MGQARGFAFDFADDFPSDFALPLDFHDIERPAGLQQEVHLDAGRTEAPVGGRRFDQGVAEVQVPDEVPDSVQVGSLVVLQLSTLWPSARPSVAPQLEQVFGSVQVASIQLCT